MSEILPSRERSTIEQGADAQAVQEYFRCGEKQKRIRYILEGKEWKPVVPGDGDYSIALPERYDRNTGMSIPPWEPEYENAVKKRPKRFR